MSRTICALGGALAVLAFSANTASAGSTTVNVKPPVPNVPVSTPKTNHNGSIQVKSFQWGVSRGITNTNSGKADREGSTPSVSEISISKGKNSAPNLIDKALDPGK